MARFFRDIYIDVLIVATLYVWALYRTDNLLTAAIGSIVTLPSIGLWIYARLDLGTSFRVLPQAIALRTSGLYAYLQHPMYVFSTLAIFGVCLIVSHPYAYIFLGLTIVVQVARAKRESRMLKARFGNEYLEYARSTWL